MYCTFVLRALGYSDAANGDFTFAGAEAFAQDVGICDSDLYSDTFLRDDAVAISYQALGTDMSGKDISLLESLIAAGAVSSEESKSILDEMAAYRSYTEASLTWADAEDVDMTVKTDIAFEMPDTNFNTSVISEIKVITRDGSIQMESISTGMGTTFSEWVKDGWLYLKSGTNMMKTPIDEETMLSLISGLNESSDLPPCKLYMIDAITAVIGNGTLYTLSFPVRQ